MIFCLYCIYVLSGVVEVFVELLKAYSKSEYLTSNDDSKPYMTTLGSSLNASVGEMLSGSSVNGSVFRETGGGKVIMDLVRSPRSRAPALALVQQLILASGGEEDMAALLELLHTTPANEVELKKSILATLTVCLRESHRARAVFRKVGGFVYVISVLMSLEGSLTEEPEERWSSVDAPSVWHLLHTAFTCLAVSMRFEPANAKFFQVEMNCGASMAETLKLLGCFSQDCELPLEASKKTKEDHDQVLKDAFEAADDATQLHDVFSTRMPKTLLSSVFVLRLLHDMATDSLGRSIVPSHVPASPSVTAGPAEPPEVKAKEEPAPTKKVPSLNLAPSAPFPAIVHAGMVTAILKLLPSLYSSDRHELSVAAQLFAANLIKTLLRSDRNQQIMCDVNLVGDVLMGCRSVLEDEAHVLHAPLHYILERLAAQKLNPSDLRDFFRLGNPLACLSSDERWERACGSDSADDKPANQQGPASAGFIPLTRIKTLVSMTTPRDLHVQTNSIMPPFVEFDMSSPEGFGCLFLPSVSPCSPHTSASVVGSVTSQASQEGSVIGGIGQGDRAFPPQPGLTFSTWVCIDKFSDPRTDPHPVRLLTLSRQLRGTGTGTGTAQEEQESFVCFSVSLSARDKAVILSCQESKSILYIKNVCH